MKPLARRNASRRLVGLALAALLLAQWTVLVHWIAHARAPAVVERSAEPDQDNAWGHHAGASACVLVDHLLTGQAPGVEHAAAACEPPAQPRVAAAAPADAPAPAARAYDARGPPRA